MIASPIIAPFLVVSGVALGSFCANTALRTTRGEQALFGPSRCDVCRTDLGYAQTTPVISFVALRGSCADCGARIDPVHPIGEIAGGVIVWSALQAATPVRAALMAAIGFALLTASIIDLKSQRLPDALTLIIAVAGAALALFASVSIAMEGVVAALLVVLVLEGVRRGYQLMRRRSGLGFGDVKLVAALALWLGSTVPWALALASLLGLAAFGVARPKEGRLAFGPFIALAAWVFGVTREAGWWPI
jgi:leader peptidase (prepilin peptidase)/N-methyltransferase